MHFQGFMWDIAPQFNAAIVFAEHRFYGKTQPFGNDSYAEVKNLGYLSSEQALADFVELIVWLKNEVSQWAFNRNLNPIPLFLANQQCSEKSRNCIWWQLWGDVGGLDPDQVSACRRWVILEFRWNHFNVFFVSVPLRVAPQYSGSATRILLKIFLRTLLPAPSRLPDAM